MILNRISPRKLWSVLDIMVCNSCKTLEAIPRKVIKVSPRRVGCGLNPHDASVHKWTVKRSPSHLRPLTQQQRKDQLEESVLRTSTFLHGNLLHPWKISWQSLFRTKNLEEMGHLSVFSRYGTSKLRFCFQWKFYPHTSSGPSGQININKERVSIWLTRRYRPLTVKRLGSPTTCLHSNRSSAKLLAMLALGKLLNFAKTQFTQTDLIIALTTEGGNKD